MFIIIETIEDGEVNLCVVPETWEKDGILFWPPGRKGWNLRKDDNILPDYNKWSKQKCTVKRRNFTTFKSAIKVEKYLSQFSDTEDEQHSLARNPPKQTECFQKNINVDFNHLIVENNNINTNIEVTENIANLPVDSASTSNPIPLMMSSNTQELESTIQFANAVMIDNAEIPILSSSKPNTLLDNVQIDEKFETINSNIANLKKDFLREISALHIKFDKLIDLLIKNERQCFIEKPQNNALNNEMLEKDIEQMKPLAIESDINILEEKLRNEEFELAFIKVMSVIGGTTGKKDANKMGYLLMDRLFERQLLTLCSWTGSTKKKEEQKVAFYKYNRITGAIYKIIRLADLRYTMDDNIHFLKRILKNSVSRSKQLQKQQGKQNDNFEEAKHDNCNVEEETAENNGVATIVATI